MKLAILALAGVLLLPAAAQVASAEDRGGAAYAFSVAKLLAEQGSLREAHRWFRRAVELEPGDAYLRLEIAGFLLRLGAVRRAAEEIAEARRLAPEDPEVLRQFGRIYLALGEEEAGTLDEAREVLEQLRRHDPADLQSMVALGQLYLSRGEGEAAVQVFRQLLQHRTASRIAYSFLVDALMLTDDRGAAETVLTGLLETGDGSLRDRMALAELQSERGDHAAAVDTLRGGPAEHRDRLELRHRLAYELFRSGRLDEAQRLVEELVRENPELTTLTYLEILILNAQGFFREAADRLGSLQQAWGPDSDRAALFARILERAGRRQQAVDLLEAAAIRLASEGEQGEAGRLRLRAAGIWAEAEEWTRLEPAAESLAREAEEQLREPAWRLLAKALFRQGRGGEALARLDAELREKDGASSALGARAELLLLLERRAEADTALAHLVDLVGADGALRAAEILQRHGNFEGSLPYLERALGERPDDLRMLFRWGAALERTGKWRKAKDVFRRLVEMEESFAPALNYLGYMWAERGENLDDALELTRRAVALEPDNGAYVDSLGWVVFQLGDLEAAAQLLERASRLEPDDAVILEHLGDVYARIGRADEAAQTYRRALELDEENSPEVERKLGELLAPAD